MRLRGHLQSWGGHTHEDVRPTNLFPTKSAIVGIVGNAMGLNRLREEDMKMLKEIDDSVSVSFRVNCQGTILTDYHTVQGAPTANNSPRNVVITHRQYLNGADFTALLEGRLPVLEKYAQALKKPERTLNLGRRCCIPSRFIFQEIVEAEDVIEAFSLAPPRWKGETESISDGIIYTEGNEGPCVDVRDRCRYGHGHWFDSRRYMVLGPNSAGG